MTNWVKHRREGKAHKDRIIAVHANGTFSFNPQAVKMYFLAARDVELFYDPKQKRVAFKIAKNSTGDSYRVTKGRHTWGVSCKSFFDRFNIDYRAVRKFIPEREGDLIVIDLQKVI